MNKVLIHLKQNAKKHLEDLGFKYQELDGELNVIVDDVPYVHEDQYYQDPDVQLCEHYGFDYGQVNCIEAS